MPSLSSYNSPYQKRHSAYLRKSVSTTSLAYVVPFAANARPHGVIKTPPKPKPKPKKKQIEDNSVQIKQENYKLTNQCNAQKKTIKHLEERLTELRVENEKLKSEQEAQDTVLKKLRAKYLYVPDSQVLSRQCIELKSKLDALKQKHQRLQHQHRKIQKQNKSLQHQLTNTNTALHNILSKKYTLSITNGSGPLQVDEEMKSPSKYDTRNDRRVNTSPPTHSQTRVTMAMQQDIEKLEQLIENLDYEKHGDLSTLQQQHEQYKQKEAEEAEKEILNIEKIMFEHGSLQNDNRDLALEVVVQQETNAKLSQSVNDLWLFSNQLLLKMEKQSTWKSYSNRKIQYINEQFVTFKKMFHRTRFYFGQMSRDYMKQILELKRIIHEILHQYNECKDEIKYNGALRVKIIELTKVIQRYESQIAAMQNERKQLKSQVTDAKSKYVKMQNERLVLLQKVDSLMSKHSSTV